MKLLKRAAAARRDVENEEKGMKAGWMTMPLAFVATFAFLFVVGTSGAGPDGDPDGDGVQTNIDNCSVNANAGQQDDDQDGYGNACDGDFGQDGIVGGPDFTDFATAFGSTKGDAAYSYVVDCNSDGVIGGPDFTCFVQQYKNGLAPGGIDGGPGPSGRSCVIAPGFAQTAQCPAPGLLGIPRAASLP